jgi:hypothetical protein
MPTKLFIVDLEELCDASDDDDERSAWDANVSAGGLEEVDLVSADSC